MHVNVRISNICFCSLYALVYALRGVLNYVQLCCIFFSAVYFCVFSCVLFYLVKLIVYTIVEFCYFGILTHITQQITIKIIIFILIHSYDCYGFLFHLKFKQKDIRSSLTLAPHTRRDIQIDASWVLYAYGIHVYRFYRVWAHSIAHTFDQI